MFFNVNQFFANDAVCSDFIKLCFFCLLILYVILEVCLYHSILYLYGILSRDH